MALTAIKNVFRQDPSHFKGQLAGVASKASKARQSRCVKQKRGEKESSLRSGKFRRRVYARLLACLRILSSRRNRKGTKEGVSVSSDLPFYRTLPVCTYVYRPNFAVTATQPKILQSFLRLFTTATNASESVSKTSKLGLVASGLPTNLASDETDTLFQFSNTLSPVV